MSDAPEEETIVNEELNWNDLTVAQLKDELVMRGLETTGKKADLVARLEDYDREMAVQQKQEEDNGEEFVEWNADDETEQDAEDGNENARKEDEKGEEEDTVASDDGQIEASVNKEESEKPAKLPDEEYSVTTSKDKDLLFLTFCGRKIIIPFRDEVMKDLKHTSKLQNIIIYPVLISDLYSDAIRPLIETAVNVSTELDETVPGHPIKGYLRLKFATVAEAVRATEIVKQCHRDGQELTVKHFADDDSEGHILSKIKKEDGERRGPLISRLVYVANLPSDVTEEALKSCFTDAVRVILPSREDSSEKLGLAYLEYGSEAEATEAAKKHRDVEFAGQKLYIIKSMTERAESFGLLKDGLRKYWLDQIRKLEASKAKSHNKTAREIQDLEAKMVRMKRRIKNDNIKRELLVLPVPESEIVEVPEGLEEEKTKNEKPSERSRLSHGGSKSAERRKSPPRRRYSPPPHRGRGSGRGFRGGPPSVSYRRGGGAEQLVDRLQELVGVLTHRDRTADFGGSYRGRGGYYDGPPRGGRGGYGGDYRDFRETSGRFGMKRPAEDYGPDRKRHESDMYYRGSSRGGFGGYSGSRRGGSGFY